MQTTIVTLPTNHLEGLACWQTQGWWHPSSPCRWWCGGAPAAPRPLDPCLRSPPQIWVPASPCSSASKVAGFCPVHPHPMERRFSGGDGSVWKAFYYYLLALYLFYLYTYLFIFEGEEGCDMSWWVSECLVCFPVFVTTFILFFHSYPYCLFLFTLTLFSSTFLSLLPYYIFFIHTVSPFVL